MNYVSISKIHQRLLCRRNQKLSQINPLLPRLHPPLQGPTPLLPTRTVTAVPSHPARRTALRLPVRALPQVLKLVIHRALFQ